jgi:predicted transcriptional regulator
MSLPCESIGRLLLPFFRAHIARELIEKYGFTQVETAKKLRTTQAAISQYLRSKRGIGDLEQFKNLLPMIQSAASEIASEIALGRMEPDKIALKFCELCLSVQKKILRT